MSSREFLFQSQFLAGPTYSRPLDVGHVRELVLEIAVESFSGDGELTVLLQHTNDEVNWADIGQEETYTEVTTVVKSYGSGLMDKFRIKLTPTPGPWEEYGAQTTVSVTALLRS